MITAPRTAAAISPKRPTQTSARKLAATLTSSSRRRYNPFSLTTNQRYVRFSEQHHTPIVRDDHVAPTQIYERGFRCRSRSTCVRQIPVTRPLALSLFHLRHDAMIRVLIERFTLTTERYILGLVIYSRIHDRGIPRLAVPWLHVATDSTSFSPTVIASR